MNWAVWSLALIGVSIGFAGPLTAHELVLAPAADARRLLATKDEFVDRMSPFDRAARLKTDRDVDEAEYLEFAAAAAREWESSEASAVEAAYRAIEPKLEELKLPLPERVLVIKTSGEEEGNAAYTRGNAIVLPHHLLESLTPTELQRLLAHELFHIASRANPKLVEVAYGVIGFRYCGEAEFPPTLATRKLTNPDAPRHDYCIRLKIAGEDVTATPIRFSRTPTYDSARGGEFFEHLELAMLVPADLPARDALPSGRGARVVAFSEVSEFFEQVGKNTAYTIHPEEILADNFALLVMAVPALPSPEVLAKLERALAELGR